MIVRVLTSNFAASDDPSKLQVAHRHGPCSPLNRSDNPTHKQILNDDQIRVDWIHRKAADARFTTASKRSGRSSSRSHSSLAASNIPTRTGSSFGTGNYIVSLGFGTPAVKQSVVFDTGSDVTWIQCQPCVSACYTQQEQLFDPIKSSTYVNISCSSPYCSALDQSGCSGSTCLYAVQYGDNSYTVGFFAQDTLTLTSSDVIPNFRFGCGEKNNGLFGQAAGLLGLGREEVSLIMQTSQKFGGVFSYCLPASSSSTGYLSFGGGSAARNVQFTPMLSQTGMATFYFLDLQSILVGGQKLALSPSLFSNAGVIIDSGTVITRLPPTAYAALRSAFRKGMAQYPTAPAASILDTCYDLRGYKTIKIPTVALQYQGAAVSLDLMGILYAVTSSQTCLAFAPNGDDSDTVIIGNTQQRRFDVVYDVSKKQIGFAPGGC